MNFNLGTYNADDILNYKEPKRNKKTGKFDSLKAKATRALRVSL